MLAAYAETENQNTAFTLAGAHSLLGASRNVEDCHVSLITGLPTGASDMSDTCSFYSGPSDAAIIAFGESAESCGSIAYEGGSESCGSIAYSSGAESCGSIASSSSVSTCACSYSC